LNELINREDPAWPLILEWIRAAKVPVEVLPVTRAEGDAALLALQVTTRSPLGALVYETGGILVDQGWLRLLGSGSPRLPRTLVDWNVFMAGLEIGKAPPFLLIADDVVGGFFAIDGGGLGFRPGGIAYFAPDSLRWESLDMGHTQFVQWVLSGSLAGFYADYRWPDWEREVSALSGDRGYLISPPPAFKGEPIPRRLRKSVPANELYTFYQKLGRELKDLPDGRQVRLTPEP
jgi:hypothetical protein